MGWLQGGPNVRLAVSCTKRGWTRFGTSNERSMCGAWLGFVVLLKDLTVSWDRIVVGAVLDAFLF